MIKHFQSAMGSFLNWFQRHNMNVLMIFYWFGSFFNPILWWTHASSPKWFSLAWTLWSWIVIDWIMILLRRSDCIFCDLHEFMLNLFWRIHEDQCMKIWTWIAYVSTCCLEVDCESGCVKFWLCIKFCSYFLRVI